MPNAPNASEVVATLSARLDILFVGPLLFIPSVSDGNVTSVDVLVPRNGHPMGAVFMPGVFFSDAELNDPDPEKWADRNTFSMLDPHSYEIDLTQVGTHLPFPAAAIPQENHKVRPGRKMRGDWEVAITISGHLSEWGSHRQFHVASGMYEGSDAPMEPSISITQRLTYTNVVGAEFWGARKEPKEYLSSNITKGGTLIIEGEVPYQASLLHERQALEALGSLAGLDIHFMSSAPPAPRASVMGHIKPCLHSIIVTE